MNLLSGRGSRLTPGVLALAVGCLIGSTQAALIIPEKSGFSGIVNLGVGGVVVESNTLAGPLSGGIDLGKEKNR